METLVLYDGSCGLCDRSVQWLLDHDPERRLRFAPLEGETAQRILAEHPEIPERLDSILFVEGDRVRWRSHAIWAICAHLPAPWRTLRLLLWVPAPLSDLGYRLVAALRYRIWGRLDTCRIPSPEQRALFLP